MINNLGTIAQDEGRYADARALAERALAIREKLDPDGPGVAMSLVNISEARCKQGDHADALSGYQRSLGIAEGKLGKDHPYVGDALVGIGECSSTRRSTRTRRPRSSARTSTQHHRRIPGANGRARGGDARRRRTVALIMSAWRLDGRTAIVTGGSRGIGRAIAEELAGLRTRVVIVARGEADGFEAIAADVTTAATLARLAPAKEACPGRGRPRPANLDDLWITRPARSPRPAARRGHRHHREPLTPSRSPPRVTVSTTVHSGSEPLPQTPSGGSPDRTSPLPGTR